MRNKINTWLSNKLARLLFFVILIGLVLVALFDLMNMDNLLYLIICPIVNIRKSCVKYYDIPLWEALTSFGTILAGVFAYFAIDQHNQQLHANQTPIIVTPFALGVKKDSISIKNIGKGVALKVFVTSDYDGKQSVQKALTPDFSYAVPTNSSQQDFVIELDSNKVSKTLSNGNIILFVHYSDSEKNLYTTVAVYREVKEKGKIVNYLFKNNEVYQENPLRIRLL